MVEGEVLRLREDWRGTRGGSYYYIEENNRLKRISEYAVKQTKIFDSRRGPTIEFEIPMSRIGEKTIYLLMFSNTGYFTAWAGKLGAFLHRKYPEYPWIPNYDLMRSLKPEELRKLCIEIEDVQLKQAIQELRTNYVSMINEVKGYSKKLDFEIWFEGHAERTSDIFNDLEVGLITCLSLPNNRARLRSLATSMKWIHQLWVMKLACDALGIKKIEKEEWQERPMWVIEQGSPYPTFIASNSDVYSFWFEFQPSKGAHLFGMVVEERIPVRPDIVICKGKFRNAKQLSKLDLIIECKNEDFRIWREEIETQVIPYFEKYRPTNMILVSLKQIPAAFKQKLENVGIKAIENLAPGNLTEIEEFKEAFLRK